MTVAFCPRLTVAPQYTGGETETGETWEDPRAKDWILFDYKAADMLMLKGEDLFVDGDQKFDLETASNEGNEEYQIEAFVGCFKVDETDVYLVKWKG